MVAKMQKDRGFSTIQTSQFNYGGGVIDAITDDMAREVLDFTIEKRPCYTEDGLVIPRMNYLRRSDGGIVDANCSVGEEFEVAIQPLEMLEFARFIMRNMPNVSIESCATIYNGGTTFINLTAGGEWLVKGDTSKHHTNVLICNPLSRGRIHLVSHSVRIVCCNTLQLGMKTGEGYRIAHTTNARVMMENALEGMRYELSQVERTKQVSEFLAGKSISSAQVDRILDMVYPLPEVKAGENTAGLTRMKTKRDEVIAQFEKDDSFTDKTFYTFLNAITYNVEHPIHKQARTDSVQVAFENITGGRAEFKAKALAKTLSVAMGEGGGVPLIGGGVGTDGEVIDAQFEMVA